MTMKSLNLLIVYVCVCLAISVKCDEDESQYDGDSSMSTIDDAVKELYDDDQPVSGERFIAVRVDKVGATETLKPTLVGLSNMAIQFLPKDYKLVEVIEATREIVSGVRYELIVAARDENGEDIVCRMVVTEITWKVTAWGDKQRDLNYSNCTSNATVDDTVPQANDFNFNPLFVYKTNFINDEVLKRIESQIIKPKQTEKPASQPKTSEISDFDLSNLEAMIIPSKSVKTKALSKTQNQSGDRATEMNIQDFSESQLVKDCDQISEKEVSTVSQINLETQTDSVQETATKQNSEGSEETSKAVTETIFSPAILEKKIIADTERTVVKETVTESSQKENTLNEPKIEEITLKSESIYPPTPIVKDTLETFKGIDEMYNLTERTDVATIPDIVETYIVPRTQISKSKSESIVEQTTAAEVRKEGTEQDENNDKRVEQILPKIESVSLQLMDAVVPPSKTVVVFESNNLVNESSTENKYKYEKIDESQDRVKREVNTEMQFLKRLATEALQQLDYVDSDNFKRIVLEIIRVKKIEQGNGAIYVIKVRTANSDCSEESDDLQTCLANVIKDTTKICFIEILSKRDVNKVTKSECAPDKSKKREATEPMRFKRQTGLGAPFPTSPDEAEEIEELVRNALVEFGNTTKNHQYGLHRIKSSQKQIVSGVLYIVDAEFTLPNNVIKDCQIKLVVQAWVKPEPDILTLNCGEDDEVTRKKRSLFYDSHSEEIEYEKTVSSMFDEFKVKFNKKYESAMEHATRFRLFKHNLHVINELKRLEMGTAEYGITEFADFTLHEYKQRTGLLRRKVDDNEIPHPMAEIPDIDLPDKFDWREKNVVSEVKNQGSCGSCWAFSVIGNIEGLNAINTGKLEEFSEQELVDCDSVDNGCNGGLPDNAYKAIEQLGGLEAESEYPYEAKKSQCKFDPALARVKVSGAVDLPKNETAMALYLVKNGPLSIGINANAMQFYRGGISHPPRILCRSGGIDHGVLIVGYGVSNYPLFNKTLPYWIIKNSWGPSWGEKGYYRVFRGADTCGVASMVSSAVLQK